MPAGIYLITNVVTGRVYVGQSRRIEERWQQHIAALSAAKHHNRALQADWSSFGMGAFSFTVSEMVPAEADLLERERCQIAAIEAGGGQVYNGSAQSRGRASRIAGSKRESTRSKQTRLVALRLPPELHARLKAMAEEDRRSLHAEILVLLDEAIAAREERGETGKLAA